MAHKKISKRDQVNDSREGKPWIQFAGWSAGKILKGNAYGPFMDIAMGIGGAMAGGMLMRSAGFGGYGGAIITTLVAMLGAVLLTLLAGVVNGRRMSARQL